MAETEFETKSFLSKAQIPNYRIMYLPIYVASNILFCYMFCTCLFFFYFLFLPHFELDKYSLSLYFSLVLVQQLYIFYLYFMVN